MLTAGFVLLEALLIGFVDRPVAEGMHALDQSHPAIVDFFRAYTDFGKSKWYLWPSGLMIVALALAARNATIPSRLRVKIAHAGNKLMFFFVAIAVSGIVTDIIKPILGRARPVELLRENIYGFHPFSFHAAWNSMPSGHATTAFALAAILCIQLPRWRFLWLALGLVLAISRIVVDAHYISDVVAGAAVGILSVIALRRMFQRKEIFPMMRCIFPIDKNDFIL